MHEHFTSLLPVHPHTRGEYDLLGLAVGSGGGSPPHAWGIRTNFNPPVPLVRFTPTRVGNTAQPALTPLPSPVHPHTRGEYQLNDPTVACRAGSPPHAWGILVR